MKGSDSNYFRFTNSKFSRSVKSLPTNVLNDNKVYKEILASFVINFLLKLDFVEAKVLWFFVGGERGAFSTKQLIHSDIFFCISDALRNLVPFAQFDKVKNAYRGVSLLATLQVSATLLKVPFLHGCFLQFCKLYKHYQIAQSVSYHYFIHQNIYYVGLKKNTNLPTAETQLRPCQTYIHCFLSANLCERCLRRCYIRLYTELLTFIWTKFW